MNTKEKNITEMIKAKILQMNPLANIILFGSHARGDANNASDWDILILLNERNVNRLVEKEYRDNIFDLELEIEEPISILVFSKTDWEQKYSITPLYRNIKKEGIFL